MHQSEPSHPVVSFAISTYNRRQVLLRSLEMLERCGLPQGAFETLVVDNASPDGTAEAVSRTFPSVRIFALSRNRGSCAKNVACNYSRGRYIVFLDDDSYPQPGAIERMIRKFEHDPHLGAAVFTINLPDGSRECSAYPDVFIGCGTGFRREALLDAGGLPEDFFMQAEEYDLSLRLLQAGWDIRTFDDLHVEHLKTPGARRSWRTMRLDVRNNLLVAGRHFPRQWRRPFIEDWMVRYYHLAAAKGQRTAFAAGIVQGAWRLMTSSEGHIVDDAVFDRFTRMSQIRECISRATRRHQLSRVLFVDYGKNILPYWLAARDCGLQIVAIADNRMAGRCSYRGIPIVNDSIARRLRFDAVIISNSSPVHASLRAELWRRLDERVVIEPAGTQTATPAAPSARKQTGLAA